MNEWREGFHLMLMKHCAGHRLQSNTQPTSRGHHSLVHSLAGSFGSPVLMDLGLIVCFSCPLPPPPRRALPHIACFIDLQDHVSIQSGEEGWATCVHWGMARKRQPLHLRGSTYQEQSRCYWCSKWKFSQCYAMTTVDADFEGVGTWTIWEAFFRKNMDTQLGTGPWGLSFISLPGRPPLVVIMWVSEQAKSAYLRQM